MKHLITIIALFITTSAVAQNKLPFQLEKDWELSGFENPESVVLDTNNKVLYVSNVNGAPTAKDKNGYISKVSLNGKIIEEKWIAKLNAPKGLVIYENKLYATDIDEIVEIDIKTKRITSFKTEGATFLNDITVDSNGNVYATNTFGFSAIYKLPKKGMRIVELWLKSNDLQMPNGIYASRDYIYTNGWGVDMNPETWETEKGGSLLKIEIKSKKIEILAEDIGNLDGLSETIHGFLLTDWLAGKLLYFANNKKTIIEALDLPQGSADIYFDKSTKSVYIPLMNNNKLLKYHFKK